MWRGLLLLSVAALMACQPVQQNSLEPQADKNPEAAEYNVQAGLGYMQQQQYQRALAKFEKALSQNTKSLPAALGKGAALQSLGQSGAAEEVYKALVLKFPQRYEAASAYAGLLCEQQRFLEAEKQINRALTAGAFARQEDAYIRLARCAVRGKRDQLAERYLSRAESIAAQSKGNERSVGEIELQSAWLAYRQKQFTEAQKRLERFESRSALRADAVGLGYQIAKAQNNVDRMATYEQILRQNYPQLWQQINNTQK